MRCNPFLKNELTSLENQDHVSFNKMLGKHLAYLSAVKAKSFILALNNGKVAIIPKNNKG